MIPDFLKKLFKGGAPAPPAYEMSSAEEAEALRDAILDQAKPAVALEIDRAAPVRGDAHSSLGGAASLTGSEEWPRWKGRPMLFLAQINYAEMPPLPGFPTEGLLSLFVEEADIFGCDFPSRKQTGFATRFTPDPSGLVRVPPPDPQPAFDMYAGSLRRNGAPMTGRLAQSLPPATQPGIEAVMRNLTLEDGDRISDWLAAERPAAMYYGGHPDFVQHDFRADGPDSEVLFQQGYLAEEDRFYICWGDAGEATFLIPPEAMAARAFDRSIYYWDCS